MKIGIIGAGFSGISSATVLADMGHEVHVYEKNTTPGGRARQFRDGDYVFDMGPSWYWMPDVFERFFGRFGKHPEDYYELEKLDPAFRVFLKDGSEVMVPGHYEGLRELFETRQKGGAEALDKFMKEAEFKYNIGINELVYKPSESWLEFASPNIIKGALRLDIFTSLRKHVRKYFKDEALISLMEFPVLFLGAMPDTTPALYSLMNFAGFKVGTYYPIGGFGAVVRGMQQLAESKGVAFHMNAEIDSLVCSGDRVQALQWNGEEFRPDAVVASADYHHVEQHLLPPAYRKYSADYWQKRTMAPSCLLYYLGLSGKVENLSHHNLFFDASLDDHAQEIYKSPRWPEDPLFYVSCPSKTDPGVAPDDGENMFLLMPISPDIEDSEEMREHYYTVMMDRIEKRCGQAVRESVAVKRSYCISDFKADYHALRGNAYGLANTLMQTAVLKPSMRHKQLKNFVYTGHLTVPGPGVPPAIISGQVAANVLLSNLKIRA